MQLSTGQAKGDMMKTVRRIQTLLLAAMAVILMSGGLVSAFASDTSDKFIINVEVEYDQSGARSMLQLINEFRTGNDAWYWNKDNTEKTSLKGLLKNYIYDDELEKAAMQRAAELVLCYDHTRPNGDTPWTAYSSNINWYGMAENIAIGYTSVKSVFEAWQETNDLYAGQGHRRNMLSSDLTHIGIAHVKYEGHDYWVQEFGKPDKATQMTSARDGKEIRSIELLKSKITRTSLSLSKDEISLEYGDNSKLPEYTFQIRMDKTYVYYPDCNVTADFVWSISDETIASLEEDSLIARKVGSTTATTTYYDADSKTDVEKSFPIHVTPIDLKKNSAVIEGAASAIYTGQPITYPLTVTCKGKSLTQNDYEVRYQNNTNAGTAAITVTGKGNYTGSVSTTFKIEQASIDTYAVSIPGQTYSSQTLTPAVTVSNNGTELQNGVDFSFTLEDATAAGDHTITVTGKGNYTGTATGTFTVSPASMENVVVSFKDSSATYTYTGESIEPDIKVSLNGIVLPETDYEEMYSNNVNAGNTAAVFAKAKENGNLTGTSTALTFVILPADISENAAVVLQESELVYNTAEQKPGVSSVELNGRTLGTETDYEVSYPDTADYIKAGAHSVKVTGKGNYTGSKQVEFIIQPATLDGANVSLSLPEGGCVYTGSAFEPGIDQIVSKGGLHPTTADYTVVYANNVDAGTNTGKVTVTGTGNYTGTAEQTFTISPANLSDAAITVQDCIYTGAPVTAVLSVNRNGAELQETTDYTVSYISGQDYTNAGQPDIQVVGCGNYTGEIDTTLNILPADVSAVIVTAPDQTWTGSELRPAVTVKLNGRVLPAEDYTVEYANNIAAGTASILVKPSGNGNLSGESASGTFVIKEKPAAPQTNPAPSTKPVAQPSSQSTQQPSSQPAQQPAAQPAPQPQQSPAVIVESITIPKAPASVKAKAKKNKVTVSWKKIKKSKKTKALLAQIHGIELQYSTEPGFPAENTVKVSLGKKKTKLVLKGLQPKTAYYVRVRYTDGSGGYSNWSKVKAFRTK